MPTPKAKECRAKMFQIWLFNNPALPPLKVSDFLKLYGNE